MIMQDLLENSLFIVEHRSSCLLVIYPFSSAFLEKWSECFQAVGSIYNITRLNFWFLFSGEVMVVGVQI